MQVTETCAHWPTTHCLGWDRACGIGVNTSFTLQIARVVETCSGHVFLLQQTDSIEGKCCCIPPVEKPRNHFPHWKSERGKRMPCVFQTSLHLCPGISNLLGLWSSASSWLWHYQQNLLSFFSPLYTGSQMTLSSCSSLFASARLSWSTKVSLTHVSPITESFCSSTAMQSPLLQPGWMDDYLTSLAVIEKKVYSFGLNNLLRCGRKGKVSV